MFGAEKPDIRHSAKTRGKTGLIVVRVIENLCHTCHELPKVPSGAFAPARRIDFWSFGVLLYVVCAELLFESNGPTGPTVLPMFLNVPQYS